jgi:hypothetical protein
MALEPNSAPPATDLPQLPRSSSWHAAPSTPVDRTGACRFLPRSHGLPRLTGGSASTTSLSRPAQASLALRPARSLARPNGGLLSRGSSPTGYPTKPLGSYHVLPTTTWVDPPSTDDLRRWGALLTLCPLGQPKKAIGLESQIEPWLTHAECIRLACSRFRKSDRNLQHSAFPLPPSSQNGPRRQGFASPRLSARP